MNVIVTPKALQQYKKLSKSDQGKVKRKLSFLENNPFLGKRLEGELSELRSLRAWPYRIIYYIDTKRKTIFITSIMHRQGVYKR